jgi:phosphoribosyl 1,2-cyclic phosphodiesterase
MNGRTIKEIFRGYADAGTHIYNIDLENLPTGEYVVVLLTHEHFLGKKLLKIKN